MPGLSRSLLISLGVALVTFLSIAGWYWIQFKRPSEESLFSLRRVMPVVEKLLENHEDAKASSLLDRLPLRVVVTDNGLQAQASNLGGPLKSRLEAGQQAVRTGVLTRWLGSPNGQLLFYYELPNDWLDAQLLFPLTLALLLGALAGISDFLQGQRQVDQTEALLMLSHLPGVSHAAAAEAEEKTEHTTRIHELEAQNRSLQAALTQARRWVLAAPDEDVRKLQQQLRQSEISLGERELRVQALLSSEQKLQEQKTELETKARSWEDRALERGAEARSLRQQHQQQEEEITRLHQDAQRQARDLESARQRLHELSGQSSQLHEAWQEITALRANQLELLQREESWGKEKQRVLALLHEKEESLEQSRDRLKAARQKIHELSVAYKKQLEVSHHLPADLDDARTVIGSLIDEKDRVEHENVELSIELADKTSETARLRKELEVRAQRLEEAQHLLEELSEALRQHERELGLLSETLTDKLGDLDRIRDLHDEKARVLEITTQERDFLRTRVADLQTEADLLRDEKLLLREAKLQLEAQLASIDVAAYQLEIEQLRQSMQLMGQQLQRRTQTAETLKTKLKEGEELYNRLKRHSDTQQQDVRRLQQEIAMYQSELNLLQKKLEQADRVDLASFYQA